MKINLKDVGMKKGQKYEGIYTTINKNNEKNAAPIGIMCKGENEIGCRIFEGSKTLANIQEQKEYVVNITNNALSYTLSTIDNLPASYFTDDDDEIAILKDTDAYLISKVKSIEKMDTSNDPIHQEGDAFIITGEVTDIKKNNPCAKAMNRGIHCLIESLVNYTRIDIVNKEKQDYYIGRFKENQRIIEKVADDKTKEAMNIIKENMIKKGLNLD